MDSFLDFLKYFLISFLATFGLLTFVGLLTGAHADTLMKDQAVDPVVKIDEDCSGTNVLIPEGKRILTAAHCTSDHGEGFVVIEERADDNKIISYKKMYYDTVRFDAKKDLALLKVRDPNYNPETAKIADKLYVDEGSKVWVTGYPLAVTRTITEGLFNGRQTDTFQSSEMTTKYRASANMTNGNSGGSMYQLNDKTGNYEIIGVSSMKYNRSEFMGLFVSLEDIRDFLRLDVNKSDAAVK